MRNYRDLTDREVREIEALYPTTQNREIVRRYGISLDGLVDNLATPRGWKKDRKNMKKKYMEPLSEDKVAWLIEHFSHTKNDDIIARLGITESSLHRLARLHGLKKTKEFIKETQKKATAIAYEVCRQHGIYEELRDIQRERNRLKSERGELHCFAPGFRMCDFVGEERWREIVDKMVASRKETVRKERMRLRWGLPQKTKLKLHSYGYGEMHRKKTVHRHIFRKHGYIVEYGDNIVYYDEHTKRRPQMEKNAHLYGLKVMERDVK